MTPTKRSLIQLVLKKMLTEPELISSVQEVTNQQRLHLRFNYGPHPFQLIMELNMIKGEIVWEYYFGYGRVQEMSLYKTTNSEFSGLRADLQKLLSHLTPTRA